MTHTDDVDPTVWADQIIHSTKPSRTLRGADAAASGRAALEAAGVDLSALEQRIAKGGRPGLDGDVTGVEEDEAPPDPLADSEFSGRVHVQLLDSEYDEFVARLNEPAQVLPGLQALLAKPSPFSASERVDQSEALLSIAEDHAIAPLVVERLAAGGGRPFNELLIEIEMPEFTSPTEPHPLD